MSLIHGRLPEGRDRTLDVFRGLTVALMILVNNPGTWNDLYPPLAHAPWHGWTLTDLVFPFFLFAVGNSLALTSRVTTQESTDEFWLKWTRRALLIFGIGLLLNAWPFVKWGYDGLLHAKDLSALRIMGVLQRIALCWAVAALIVRMGGTRAATWASAVLLLGYWVACLLFTRGADPYSIETFFGTNLDRALLGEAHMYHGEGVAFDPEGLGSTPPAIAQVLLGYLVGNYVVHQRKSADFWRKLCFVGVALTIMGLAADSVMPINKKLWTSSYVLLTSGLATIAVLLLLALSTVKKSVGYVLEPLWRCSEAFGRNALLIFALSGLVPRTLALIRLHDEKANSVNGGATTLLPWIHREFFAPLGADPRLGSLLFAMATLMAYAILALWLHHRRWYFKA